MCPVGGHNFHGLVERKIRTIQQGLQASGIENMRLHATGVQTLVSLVSNDINNVPLGYAYGRDENNSPLLRLLSPNMLKIGRNNSRALDGPMKLPSGPGELLANIEKCYQSWFKIWNDTLIPKLMKVPKWFKNDRDLRVGDIVYFQKRESELGAGKWTVGQVDAVEKGKDGFIREATVRYQNSNENQPRTTDRSVRKLVKLFSIDDVSLKEEMQEVEDALIKLGIQVKPIVNPEIDVNISSFPVEDLFEEMVRRFENWEGVRGSLKDCKKCCCGSHCHMNHNGMKIKSSKLQTQSFSSLLEENTMFLSTVPEEVDDNFVDEMTQSYADPLSSLMMSINLNLDC